MKKTAVHSPANPYFAWADLVWTLSETLMASAEVIAHRTTRMAAAGPLPSARDLDEFTRMGQEKFEAASESTQALATSIARMNLQLATSAFRSALAGTMALLALAGSRDVGQAWSRHAKLADTFAQSTKAASVFTDSTMRLASHGLKPIHARATANARRLGRR